MMRIKTSPETTVRVERTYRAPIFRIFDAWTDPTMLSQWWGPFPGGEGDTHQLIFEATPYGAFHWVLSDSEGRLHTIRGEVRECVTREKLQFSWIETEGMHFFDPDEPQAWRKLIASGEAVESVVNIDFREGQGVEIRVLQIDLPNSETRDAVELGWERALERFDMFLQNGSKAAPAKARAKSRCA